MTMLKIAVTGGIGSGKSYVCRLMSEEMGFPIYDTDSNAKRLNEESSVIRQGLQHMVGEKVYDGEGHLVKEVLTKFLFSSPENGRLVNALIHPVVVADFEAWAEKQQSDGVILETALLQESGLDSHVDITVRVDAPRELCLSRAMARDGVSQEKILDRMKAQRVYQNPDYVIVNDGKKNLINQIKNINYKDRK